MAERARLWQRVSTGAQDEASQLPDLMRWCDTHDYEYNLDERYVVHAKSAYHKKQEKALKQAISDMANGQYTVLVVWFFDRIQRGSTLEAFTLAEQARAAGGRIEYVNDAYLNETNAMSDVMLALAATAARQESERKSKRIRANHEMKRAEGSVIGKPPWGYQIYCTVCKALARQPKCKSHKKIFQPTPEGRKYIPLMYQAVINGQSLRDICIWLGAEGIKTTGGKPWNEAHLGNRLIRNPVYYGQRRNAGQLETEALVSYSVWQQAKETLATRARRGRGTVKHDKAFTFPECGNPDCDATGAHPSPMYRTHTRDGWFYRCTGRGAQRRGCGNLIAMSEIDERVTELMADDANWHVHRDFIPGDDRSDAIGKIREQGAEAMKQGDYAGATECMRQAEELESLPRVAPHWEDSYTCHQCGMVKDVAACIAQSHDILTEGEYFASLDREGQRIELAENWIVSAYRYDGLVVLSIIHKSFT